MINLFESVVNKIERIIFFVEILYLVAGKFVKTGNFSFFKFDFFGFSKKEDFSVFFVFFFLKFKPHLKKYKMI